MVFGSFVAGATPLGGGAVAFPVFTKLLAIPANDARLFSLAIQSVGMTCATLFFLSQRTPIYWRELKYCFPASLIVIPVTLYTSNIDGPVLKFVFSEFILITAWVIWLCNHTLHARNHQARYRRVILICSAAIGSFLSVNIGSGSDVILFFVMVFILKYSVKDAVPSTVVLMAFNAVYAASWFVFIKPIELSDFVINSWWAACLIVSIGAPTGAYVLSKLKESMLRKLIYFIISLELLSTIFNPELNIHLRYLLVASSCLLLLVIAHKTIYRHKQNRDSSIEHNH